MAPLAALVAAGVLLWAVLGWMLARQLDAELNDQRREMLQATIQALQAAPRDPSVTEASAAEALARAFGLKQLDVASAESERDARPVLDRNGRIVGWLERESQRPATQMMLRLLPLTALVGLGLAGLGGFAFRRTRRLGFLLARSDQQVRKLEHEDPATGLPNKGRLLKSLDHTLAGRSDDAAVGLVVIDLDGFAELRDTLGEATSGDVLVETVRRLCAAMPADVIVGRLDRDEFALVLPKTDAVSAEAIAAAARDAVSPPIWVNHVVQVSVAIGLALAPRDGTTARDLLRRAKLALRAAARGAIVPFAPRMEQEFEERRFIKREIGRALAARDFDVHYQPIVEAEDGAVVGVEALLRWRHPARGYIPPASFIPIAEQAGLMDQLGEFVLRRALSDAARWDEISVAVNLSPLQMRDRRIVDLVGRLLAESKIDPARLVLEVTEGVLIDNAEAMKSRLEELRALGVRLALDDFGAGFSSLTYLQRLPFDILKVDRGFTAALEQSANAGVIIQAIVSLGRALGLSVLIEGVETPEQRVLLRLAGCNLMQGFLFARPGPAADIDRRIAKIAPPARTAQARAG